MATAQQPIPSVDERPAAARPVLSYILVVACGAAFAALYHLHGGIDLLTLVCSGAKDRELILQGGEWWRLVSAGFLHADGVHLAANLLSLAVIGPQVERLWGTARFLLVYLAGLVGGSLASLAATPEASVGASGAICGLLGALIVFSTVYRRFLPPERWLPAWLALGAAAALQVLVGILVPFVDNAGHAGGFVAGGLAALALRPIPARSEPSPIARIGVAVACAGAVLLTAYSLAMAADYALESGWAFLVGVQMEPCSVEGGELTLSVPRGWTYEGRSSEDGAHTFRRQGIGGMRVRVAPGPQGQEGDVRGFAQWLRGERLKAEGRLLAERRVKVGDQIAADLLFQHRVGSETQRHRDVVFSPSEARVVHVSCACLEPSYDLLEIVFDKVIQSIRVRGVREPRGATQQLWERAIERPRDPEVCVALAEHYAQEKRFAPAERLLRLALRIRPGYAEAHDRLADLHLTAPPAERRPDRAVSHALRAIAIQPDKPRYLHTLARAYEAAGDRPNALEAARRAAALAPTDALYSDLVKRLQP